MEKKINELLPIGSVIRLVNGKKSLVITGILQHDLETDVTYDYMAVPYPEGFISKEYVFFAQHENIEKVIFKGYSDSERDSFIEEMKNYYNEK